MKRYLLSSGDGTLLEEPLQDELWELDANQSWIILSTLSEFESNGVIHPCKKDLLHSLNYEKYCKVEFYNDSFQGIIRVPIIGEKMQNPFVFGFLMYQNQLWLVSDSSELFVKVKRIQEDVYPGFSMHDFLLSFFNHLIEDDMISLQKIEDGLELVEERVISNKQQTHLNEVILKYGRRLSKRHGYYVQLMNVGDYMQTVLREICPDAENGWSLFTHRVERLHGYVEQIREYLLQIREMYQTQVDIQQNKVVTFLTVVTTIFLPLTLITGWYGMNFYNMPELGWKYGYLCIIVLSLIILAIEIWYFRKKKML